MSEIGRSLVEIAARVEALERENATLRAQVAAQGAVWPAVQALYEAMGQQQGGIVQKVKAATNPVGLCRYGDEDVRRWQARLIEGVPIRDVAREFRVDPATVKNRVKRIGGICACGVIIGTEEEGVAKGQDGVCGYCREEKVA